jgi:hypothetical protein
LFAEFWVVEHVILHIVVVNVDNFC